MAKKPVAELLSNLYRVRRSQRMNLLRAVLDRGVWVASDEIEDKRRQFCFLKHSLLPILANTKCYVCDKHATDRHHVLPLCRGGQNDSNNLVPLCQKCHNRLRITSGRSRRWNLEPLATYPKHSLQVQDLNRHEIKALSRGSLSSMGRVVVVGPKKTATSVARLPAPKKVQSTTISLGKVEARLLEPAWHYALPLEFLA